MMHQTPREQFYMHYLIHHHNQPGRQAHYHPLGWERLSNLPKSHNW